MINRFSKICFLILVLCFCFIISGCEKSYDNQKMSIVSTSFPGYDFSRAIVKDSDISVEMLVSPGVETHDFEPTPKDIQKIKNSDLFIYVGGDSDSWINDIIDDIDINKTKVIKLIDLVDVVNEESVEGMEGVEDDDDVDEHVWTSPMNAITIIEKLESYVEKMDEDNKIKYKENASSYINEIGKIDSDIRDVVDNSLRREVIFGDRFPLRYFVDEYGLSYYAAFPGCSEQTEASAKTISFLIDKAKFDHIPVIFKIELSNGKIAKEIASDANAKVLEFGSCHNVSLEDFNNGVTYVDIMKKNIDVLKEALN